MSHEEADKIMTRFDKWDIKQVKRNFIHRMEHKFFHKKRLVRMLTRSKHALPN